jgi:hypothetical protein
MDYRYLKKGDPISLPGVLNYLQDYLQENFLMDRSIFLSIFFFAIFNGSGLYAAIPELSEPLPVNLSQQDTMRENQILYNGKIWRNLYYLVKGDQFLFSKDFLTGTISINGKSFKNISIRYDIFNDEIMTTTNHGSILQLNKEMVDSFTIFFGYKTYKFLNTQADSLTGIKGYVNALYIGKSALYVKYKKEIQSLAVDDKYDLFFQTYRIYFLKDGIVHQITSKSDFFKILSEDKARIRDFMKKNKLKVSKKVPESFIPVIRYYDILSQ